MEDNITEVITEDQFRQWMKNAGMCSCGESDVAIRTLINTLRSLLNHDDRNERLCLALPDAGSRHIVLSWLDRNGIIEHGGSLGGAWLTDAGKMILAYLESLDDSGIERLLDGSNHRFDA